MQQSDSLHSGHLSKYGAGTLKENLSDLQHITIASHCEKFNDPLGVAERGKVGVPPSSSECSSNSSADASVESNMGILNGQKKGIFKLEQDPNRNLGVRTWILCYFSLTDRRLIMSETKSFDSNSTSTTLKETRIDNRIERSSSQSSRKYQKIPIVRQTSIDHAPDVSNNNQDVIHINLFQLPTSVVLSLDRCHLFQCIVVLSQEPLFDTSDLTSLKSELDLNRPNSPSSTMGRYGSVEVSLLYDAPMRKMTVHVLQARGIACRDKGQPTHTQVSDDKNPINPLAS